MGEHDTSTDFDLKPGALEAFTVQDIDVERAIAYPKYNKHTKQNDIGLIRLESPANLKKRNIGTICLPVEESNQFDMLDEMDIDIKNNLNIAGSKSY